MGDSTQGVAPVQVDTQHQNAHQPDAQSQNAVQPTQQPLPQTTEQQALPVQSQQVQQVQPQVQ